MALCRTRADHVALHNRLDFHFNDDETEAQVFENVCLALTATPSPLAYLFPYGICTRATVFSIFRTFTMVKEEPGFFGGGAPIWHRNTYFNEKGLLGMYDPMYVADKQPRAGGSIYPEKMQFGDGYKLVPLLTPEGGLNKKALAKALKVSGGKIVSRNY